MTSKSLPLLLPLLFALALPGWSAVTNPVGADRPTNASDFHRHPNQAKEFNEVWSYQFVLDNGTKAFVNISWMVLPKQGPKVGCELSFYNFKGNNESVGRQYPTARLSEDKQAHILSVKDEYILQNLPGKGHRVFFTADKGGKFFLDLTFDEAIPGVVPGDGVFKVYGQQFGYYLHIPWGKVKGRIGLDGDTLSVQGTGMMEHTWQTAPATKLASRSMVFASPSQQSGISGRLGITHDKPGSLFGYAVAWDKGVSRILLPESAISKEEVLGGGSGWPSVTKITWKDAAQPALTFDATKRQQRFSILSNFDGWIERQAARVMMGGELVFMRGRASSSYGMIDWIMAGF